MQGRDSVPHRIYLQKDLFNIIGLVLLASGGMLISIGIIKPLCEKNGDEIDGYTDPIFVQYELPNYSEMKGNHLEQGPTGDTQ